MDQRRFIILFQWLGVVGEKFAPLEQQQELLENHTKIVKLNYSFYWCCWFRSNLILNQWDIVIPSELIQHDMDARPLFPKFVIPVLKRAKIYAQDSLVSWATQTLRNSISGRFGKVENGLVATADKFIADKNLLDELKIDLPDLKAVEMEGAESRK